MAQGAATPSRKGAANGRRPAVETEHAFIAAATDLFAEKGYNGTSILDLAKRLGLTTASLYYHVSGKQELLLKVLTRPRWASTSSSWSGSTPKSKTPGASCAWRSRTICHSCFTTRRPWPYSCANGASWSRRTRSTTKSRWTGSDALLTEIIDAGMAGSGLPSSDPHLIRLAILGMINWVVEWYRPGGRLDADEIRTTFADLVTERLLAPPKS